MLEGGKCSDRVEEAGGREGGEERGREGRREEGGGGRGKRELWRVGRTSSEPNLFRLSCCSRSA